MARHSGDTGALASALKDIVLPSRSPALTQLAIRLAGPVGLLPAGSAEEDVIRAAMLYRGGRILEADAVLGRAGPDSPIMAALVARAALAVGDRERACTQAVAALQSRELLPPGARAEMIALQGYCGAAQGNASAAGLAAGLARDEGSANADTLAALEAVAVGERPRLGSMQRVGIIEWRLAELAGEVDPAGLQPERAEPALLAAMARASALAPPARLSVAELAARANVIDAATLAEAYRAQSFSAAELEQALTARIDPVLRRALLFRAAEAERTPFKRTRLVRAALDDARRAGLYLPMAAALSRAVEDVRHVAEIGWFAETAVEIMFAAGRLPQARRWAEAATDPRVGVERAGAGMSHWQALIDIADPSQRDQRGASLGAVEELALRSRFTPEGLHRLASVLDALDYHVPMRLWEAASRSPQPTAGHLPETGVLSALQAAAKSKDLPATIGLVFKALGPDGPTGAHMIALGDSIRALKRAGLDREARALAAEALFALWPRTASG